MADKIDWSCEDVSAVLSLHTKDLIQSMMSEQSASTGQLTKDLSIGESVYSSEAVSRVHSACWLKQL